LEHTSPVTTRGTTTRRLTIGQILTASLLDTIRGGTVPIPDAARVVHLQFRRFAGCPICNLHLRSIAKRHDELVAAGVREVAVFHSSADHLRSYDEMPFDVVADPERHLYRDFGVEPSVRAVLDPRSWPAAVRGLFQRRPDLSLDGGPLGLPADFLIGSDGRVLALEYGAHADDQWSVVELLAHAREARSSQAWQSTT